MKIYNFLKTLIALSLFLLSGSAFHYISSFTYKSLIERHNVYEVEYREKIDLNNLLGTDLIASAIDNNVTDEVVELIKNEIPDAVVVAVELPVEQSKEKKKIVKVETKKYEEVKMDLVTSDIRSVVIERTDLEINNDKLVEHYGFDVPVDHNVSLSALYSDLNISGMLASLEVESGYSESNYIAEEVQEIQMDSLTTQLSSTEKKTDETQYNDDDIVVMDYTIAEGESVEYVLEEENVITSGISSLTKKGVSDAVLEAMTRSLKEMSNQNRIASNDFVVPSAQMQESLIAEMTGMKKSSHSGDYSSVVEIKAIDVSIHDGKNERSTNFEFIPEYNKSNHQRDEDGVVTLESNLKDKTGTIRGSIIKNGKMRTKVDLIVEQNHSEFTIPLLDQEQVLNILEEEGLNLGGGFVLVELEESVVEVELDGEYKGMLYLDNNLKLVKEDQGFHYKLFTGVESGNRLLSFATTSNEVAQKLIHVVEDEVYYESGLLEKSNKREVELFEKNLMGTKEAELNINENFLTYFNRKDASTKMALNLYEVKVPVKAYGTRSYLETSHLGETIYLGLNGTKEVEVPSREFIEKMMNVHNLRSLEGVCVVQLNITSPIKEVFADGETFNGPMNLRVTYLDKDGLFNYEPTEVADKIFLMGDLQGVINIKLDYLNGKSDYVQTFCSEESYLVEQL